MPKISIIIPIFNHARELPATLLALSKQTVKDFEIIVVDDCSTDGLAAVVEQEQMKYSFTFLRLAQHSGAPVARNTGFRASMGELVLFLDADTCLLPNALELYVKALSDHPEVSFAYASFRFGGKLFASRSFDAEKLKERNYIHTSAMIRRDAFPGFDESLKKFQDWDLWLTMIERGSSGVFINQCLSIISERKREGRISWWLPRFAYDLPWPLFGWTPAPILLYRNAEKIICEKHHLQVVKSSSSLVVRTVLISGLVMFLLELFSFLVVFHPFVQSAIAVLLAIGFLALCFFDLSLGFSVLASEYILGSKGYLFRFELRGDPNGGVSIRELFFGAFLFAWLVQTIRFDWWKVWKGYLETYSTYLVLAFVLVFAFLQGLFLHQPFLVSDANGWGVWLLLFPALDVIRVYGSDRKRLICAFSILGTAVFVLSMQSLGLFYLFSHDFPAAWVDRVYRWLRRSQLAEVTQIIPGESAYRIFFQSYVYPVMLVPFLFLTGLVKRRGTSLLTGLTVATILISFSRSFWIGCAAMLGLGVLGLLIHAGISKSVTVRSAGKGLMGWLMGVLVGLALVFASLYFPLPKPGYFNPADLFFARASVQDPASQSRWLLLPVLIEKIEQSPWIGHGFGATVTYQSKDPRVVATTGGSYTTFAFEWGWLDFVVKFGLLGTLLYTLVLLSLVYHVWRSAHPLAWKWAAVLTVVGLAVIHVFTPYLNHPLGFLWLIGLEMFVAASPHVSA